MATIDDIADYVISRLTDGGESLNQLKLQKLLYYIQAWHLAIHDRPIVQAKFQAWIHGPVNRQIFDRFKANKLLYSSISADDISNGFDSSRCLSKDDREFVDAVLEIYGPLTGDQLEEMTHWEDPWIQARGGVGPDVRCENELDERLMAKFYRARAED